MRKPPLISLSVKVGLVLFAVVAGALAIVYVAVVPQLEDRLVDAKIDELERRRTERGQPAQRGHRPDYGRGDRRRQQGGGLQHAGRRPRRAHGTDDELQILADSRRFRVGRRVRRPDRARGLPHRGAHVGPDRVGRAALRGGRLPAPRQPRLLLVVTPLDDVLANVRLVRRSLLVAGAAALAISWLAGYLLALGTSRAGSGGSRRRRSASPRATSRRRSSTADATRSASSPTPSTACARDSRSSTARGGSSSPTPRTSCGHRSSRSAASSSCSTTRTWNPRCAATSSPRCGDQIDRLTRLATDLLDLSRLDAGQLEVEIEPFDLAATAQARRRRVPRGRRGDRARAAGRGRRPGRRARRRAARAADRACPRRERDSTHACGDDGGRAVWRRARTTACSRCATTGPGSRRRTRSTSSSASIARPAGKASGSGLGLAIASELALRGWTGRSSCRRSPGAHRFHVESACRRDRRPPKPQRRSRGRCRKLVGRAETCSPSLR